MFFYLSRRLVSGDAYAAQSTPFLRVPPPQGDPRIPTTVRNFCRSLELEERGLCLPQPSHGLWPLLSAELYATHLTASVTPMPATSVALILPLLSARNQVSLQQTHSSFHVLVSGSRLHSSRPRIPANRHRIYWFTWHGAGSGSPTVALRRRRFHFFNTMLNFVVRQSTWTCPPCEPRGQPRIPLRSARIAPTARRPCCCAQVSTTGTLYAGLVGSTKERSAPGT